MASTMTATTMGADGHLGGPLAPKQMEEEAHADQERVHQNLPQHLEGDGPIEDDCQDESKGDDNDGNASNGDKEREDSDFNQPTPLRKNHGFFKESQSELQNEPPEGSNAEDGQQAANPIEPQSQNTDDGATALTEPDSAALSQSPEQVHQSPIATRRKRRVAAAVIEGDASTAFSHYLPVAPLSSLPGNAVASNSPDDKTGPKRRRGKRRRDKRDRKKDRSDSVGGNNGSEKRPRDGPDGIDGSASSLISDGDALQTNAQHVGDRTASRPRSNDPIHILEAEDDPILHNYLPQLAFLNDNYYSRVKPYRMGRRDLPLNQIEVILRRRAVKKRTDVERESNANGAATGKGSGKDGAGSKRGSRSVNPPPPSGRPPLQHQHSPPRRKLFPTQQQRSPTPSRRNSGHYEDDSTISSMSVTSQTTPAVSILQPSMPLPTPHQQPDISSGNTAIAISEIPKEEIVGDTSLGLKLTILQGKVIVQNITALEDGRASPGQLCGLISIGDIIVAVNGKSLIKGTVHNPVGMDRIIAVLKPLSQPTNEETKEYSREVRLRFALGEGKPLLSEQKEREQRKIEERMHRKKLGLDGARGTVDPAADLFGIGALMGVDQHSGMPMFGHLDHRQHRDSEGDEKEEKKEGDGSAKAVLAEEENVQVSAGKPGEKQMTRFYRARPSVQAQIARQVQLDRQWNRNRITSGFFAMDSKAPILLRPPSPPPDHSNDPQMVMNSIDGRKRRLERGAQTVVEATSLVAMVEAQDNGIEAFEDEDPMEVASRVCGTASIRTGASKRRWHRGDAGTSITEGDATSAVSGASSMELNTSIRSGESLVEACDHRLLVELAANNDSWKANVLKRLESYAEETEKECNASLHRGSSDSSGKEEVTTAATGFDGLLFGGDVASMLGKKKQSLALPPGEMTSMLYDLVELLEGGLPDQIFMKDESPPNGPEKAVSFANGNVLEKSADVAKATDFLVDNALGKWLKSFRPLPWKQRRALWPPQQYGGDADSTYASSRLDDNESLSLMSGTTAARSKEKDKRNLRELIEDLELDHETRRETCRLATFYFTNKYSTAQAGLSPDAEEEAAAFVDEYGSYLDISKCLVFAGRVHSKALVDKLVGVAKYDPQHKESAKALQKAKVLLFYEPNMLSALIEMLPSISSRQLSSNFDFVALLVSAYPDLQPWCVHEASHSEHSGNFYEVYLSSLMDDEEGNDAAKRDKELVKEWCLMLCNESDSAMKQTNRQRFFHIATRDSERSLIYYRDLPFLLDVSVKMSEFGLTLSLANEIVLNPRYCRDEQVLRDVVQHLFVVVDKAIEGNEGEINAVLLGEVITFFNILSPHMEEHGSEFDSVAELSKLLEKCYVEQQKRPRYSSSNIDTCLAIISENAPPDHSLQVLSQWEHTSVDSPALISALHASLVRGAREGIQNEISGSLLRIQRAREEGRRPMVDTAMMSWTADADELGEDQEGEGCIWSNILDGTLTIAK